MSNYILYTQSVADKVCASNEDIYDFGLIGCGICCCGWTCPCPWEISDKYVYMSYNSLISD